MMIDVLSLETKIFKTQKYFVANPLSASERLFRKITILKLSFSEKADTEEILEQKVLWKSIGLDLKAVRRFEPRAAG